MRENNRTIYNSTKKKNKKLRTHPLYPHRPNQLPIICNNNTMDMAFQVQMRQTNKCGSVWNDEIINLHSESGAGPWVSSPASCKTPVKFIDSIRPNNQPGKNKESRNETQLPTNCIVLPWPTYTKLRAKTGKLGT